MQTQTIRDLIRLGQKKLEDASPATFEPHEARWIFESIAHFSAADAYTRQHQPVSESLQAEFWKQIQRRLQGEPLAYVLHNAPFGAHTFRVSPATLIPRTDTLCLVNAALSKMQEHPTAGKLLELGVGCGAVILSIALDPRARGWTLLGTDLSTAALAIATSNHIDFAKDLEATALLWKKSDWFSELTPERWDIIVSNPPYISAQEWQIYGPSLQYEPRSALLADGALGEAALATIIRQAPSFLKPGGWLCLEHGFDQSEWVQAFFKKCAYTAIKTLRDEANHPRVTWGCWTPSSKIDSGARD